MDKDNQQSKGRDLTSEERKELREGLALEEMTNGPGWEVVTRMLKDRAYHSWVDPREADSLNAWMWREMNSFHSADVAKQILVDVQRVVDRAKYLEKVMSGEIDQRHMKI